MVDQELEEREIEDMEKEIEQWMSRTCISLRINYTPEKASEIKFQIFKLEDF